MLEYLLQAIIRCLKYTLNKLEQYTRHRERVLGKKSEEQAAQRIAENVGILIRAAPPNLLWVDTSWISGAATLQWESHRKCRSGSSLICRAWGFFGRNLIIRSLTQHVTYHSPHAQSRLYRFAGRISNLSSNLGNWPTGPSDRLDCPGHRLA